MSPESTVVFAHSGSKGVVDTTYLGREFSAMPMGWARSSSIVPQEAAKIS